MTPELEELRELLAEIRGVLAESRRAGLRADGDRYLGKEGIARFLAISTRSVDRMVQEGLLPEPVEVRSSLRWRLSDIELFIAKKKTTSRRRSPGRRS